MIKYFIYLLLLFPLAPNIQAQATLADEAYKNEPIAPSRMDKENWAKITKGVSYTPQEPKKIDPIDFPDININPPNLNLDAPLGAFEIFSKILLWGLVILVLGFIVFRVVAMTWNTNKKIEKQAAFSLEHVEANLMESDLDKFLREALSKNDYRLAVRVYFLTIIKDMTTKGLIHWKKDKTNGAYLSELYKNTLYQPFRRIVYAFEYVWFNNADFGQSDFGKVEPEFKQFLKTVNA